MAGRPITDHHRPETVIRRGARLVLSLSKSHGPAVQLIRTNAEVMLYE
jgi:hypothetical protein